MDGSPGCVELRSGAGECALRTRSEFALEVQAVLTVDVHLREVVQGCLVDASVHFAHLECERSVGVLCFADLLLAVWEFIAGEVACDRPGCAVLGKVEVCVVADDGQGVCESGCIILVTVSDAVVEGSESESQFHTLRVLHMDSHFVVTVSHLLVFSPRLCPLLVDLVPAHFLYCESVSQFRLFRFQSECRSADHLLTVRIHGIVCPSVLTDRESHSDLPVR